MPRARTAAIVAGEIAGVVGLLGEVLTSLLLSPAGGQLFRGLFVYGPLLAHLYDTTM
jgi:hypothetical protein